MHELFREETAAGILSVMEWPVQSPDLNPIELLWEQLDRMVRNKCPSSQEEGLLEAWGGNFFRLPQQMNS
ncbi:hypothetical protein GDO81_024212 [Engystomops pustulosus]|uniref:Tc1-like transposase DDE domain-containing protein n=1 Tax=Engystomops pustulosus TaxID=76066 RepID=A0AAV6YRV7_ENGPU|nr:hypothetical protein GDO81_024212 [Engystomops pustulosus]